MAATEILRWDRSRETFDGDILCYGVQLIGRGDWDTSNIDHGDKRSKVIFASSVLTTWRLLYDLGLHGCGSKPRTSGCSQPVNDPALVFVGVRTTNHFFGCWTILTHMAFWFHMFLKVLEAPLKRAAQSHDYLTSWLGRDGISWSTNVQRTNSWLSIGINQS